MEFGINATCNSIQLCLMLSCVLICVGGSNIRILIMQAYVMVDAVLLQIPVQSDSLGSVTRFCDP